MTDFVNGSNLIINGDVIWGGLMVALPFLPMLIAMLWLAFSFLTGKDNRCWGLLLLIVSLPAAVLGTPLLWIWVLLAALLKLYDPVMKEENRRSFWLNDPFVKDIPALLRMGEVVGESYPQALLGEWPLTW